MAKRINIGLLFTYDENWIGGSYYIMNLIHSLNLLEDSAKPKLIIFSEKDTDFDQIKTIQYPYIQYELLRPETNLVSRYLNKFFRNFFFKRNIIKNVNAKIDFLFPASGDISLSWIKKQLFWIPDFQELHLPQFYPDVDLEKRKNNRRIFANSKKHVMFSSQDALNDYNFFFQGNTTKNEVLNFAVFHPDFSDINETVLLKYGLSDKKYFFSPNQFWKHKNHFLVLKALVLIKNKGKLNFRVAFSGKEQDYRNPDYFNELKNFVEDNKLQDDVKFLGFIDRKEQLYLMNNALAIIQPSLFEGWSTVVEDAKRLNQNCIASNLKVHQEQLGGQGFYFDPHNVEELAMRLEKFDSETISKPNFNYQENSKLFGLHFMEIVKKSLR